MSFWVTVSPNTSPGPCISHAIRAPQPPSSRNSHASATANAPARSVYEAFAKLAAYDYPPARQAVEQIGELDGAKLIDVDILGHIFEQSITEPERMRTRLEGRLAEEEPEHAPPSLPSPHRWGRVRVGGPLGNDAAITRHRSQAAGTFQGVAFEEDHRCVMVCVRQAADWRIVMGQSSLNGD